MALRNSDGAQEMKAHGCFLGKARLDARRCTALGLLLEKQRQKLFCTGLSGSLCGSRFTATPQFSLRSPRERAARHEDKVAASAGRPAVAVLRLSCGDRAMKPQNEGCKREWCLAVTHPLCRRVGHRPGVRSWGCHRFGVCAAVCPDFTWVIPALGSALIRNLNTLTPTGLGERAESLIILAPCVPILPFF